MKAGGAVSEVRDMENVTHAQLKVSHANKTSRSLLKRDLPHFEQRMPFSSWEISMKYKKPRAKSKEPDHALTKGHPQRIREPMHLLGADGSSDEFK